LLWWGLKPSPYLVTGADGSTAPSRGQTQVWPRRALISTVTVRRPGGVRPGS